MSVTTTTYWGAGKHFRMRFGIAVCGLAIAAAAIAAIVATSNGDDAAVGTGGAFIADDTAPAGVSPTQYVYYLVATQEEADRYGELDAEDEMAAAAAGMDMAPVVRTYLVIDTPERDEMANLLVQDINAHALETNVMTTQVIDLRNP